MSDDDLRARLEALSPMVSGDEGFGYLRIADAERVAREWCAEQTAELQAENKEAVNASWDRKNELDALVIEHGRALTEIEALRERLHRAGGPDRDE